MGSDSTEMMRSIGVDIGTTSTQVVLSDLTLSAPRYDGAAKVEILDRRVRYRSPIHETPYARRDRIHTAAVVELIDREVRRAGFTPDDVDTGAVIATGEAARTENAERLIERLADHVGEFVVTTAGASLEAVLAGYGSGAGTRSEREHSTVATVDIGGGTTNIAVFVGGEVRQTRCIDVGGRDVEFDEDGSVVSVAESLRPYLESRETPIAVGAALSSMTFRPLARWMADRVFDSLDGPPFDEATRDLAIVDLPSTSLDIDEVVFTGGVGRLVSADTVEDDMSPFEYDDLGVLLAAAIREHGAFASIPVHRSGTDIRATVIGVGTRTTTFSGRTVAPDESLLPTRNLPIVWADGLDDADSADVIERRTIEAIRTATDRDEVDEEFALYAPTVGPLTYDRIKRVATGIVEAYGELFEETVPLVLLTKQNCAKILGQTLAPVVGSRSVMVLDEIEIGDERYVDLGTQVANGTAVPATVKTLVFDE